mmetsp:Transcript_73450/g.195178  ORF Transcript_73450/g.195178 Transcript_73450/m.195178 type:complete len:314 (-) Transcript_73450:481-1422(-)
MLMVFFQEEGKSGPGSSMANSWLRKCEVLCSLTAASSANSSRKAKRTVGLRSGGTNASPSSRLSDMCGLKMSLSNVFSSSLKAIADSPSSPFQNAPPMDTQASKFSVLRPQLPLPSSTRPASERLNESKPRSTPCKLGRWKMPGRCTRAALCTKREPTTAVSACAAAGSTPRTALGRLTATRLTALRTRLERTAGTSCVGTNSRAGLLSTTAETGAELTAEEMMVGMLTGAGAETLTARFGRAMRKRSRPKDTAVGLWTIMPLAVGGGAMRPGRLSWNLSTPNSTPPYTPYMLPRPSPFSWCTRAPSFTRIWE